jgi:hypothetical protein
MKGPIVGDAVCLVTSIMLTKSKVSAPAQFMCIKRVFLGSKAVGAKLAHARGRLNAAVPQG